MHSHRSASTQRLGQPTEGSSTGGPGRPGVWTRRNCQPARATQPDRPQAPDRLEAKRPARLGSTVHGRRPTGTGRGQVPRRRPTRVQSPGRAQHVQRKNDSEERESCGAQLPTAATARGTHEALAIPTSTAAAERRRRIAPRRRPEQHGARHGRPAATRRPRATDRGRQPIYHARAAQAVSGNDPARPISDRLGRAAISRGAAADHAPCAAARTAHPPTQRTLPQRGGGRHRYHADSLARRRNTTVTRTPPATGPPARARTVPVARSDSV